MTKYFKSFAVWIGVAIFAIAGIAVAQNVVNYNEQGGARMVIGGTIDIISGGDLDIESGGVFSIAGTTMSATAVELNLIDGYTGTTAELNQAADHSSNTEVVAATNVITAAESGSTFFLNNATEFASTLPAVAAGLRYKFIITAAPVGASYTIGSNAGADVITVLFTAGGINDASDQATAQDVITFVDGASLVGDWVECICDGTNWACQGSAAVAAGITTGAS